MEYQFPQSLNSLIDLVFIVIEMGNSTGEEENRRRRRREKRAWEEGRKRTEEKEGEESRKGGGEKRGTGSHTTFTFFHHLSKIKETI